MVSLTERCLGDVDRVIVWTGRVVDEKRPWLEWPTVFTVNVIKVGADGFDIGLWDGETHQEALAAAREISADWGIAPIIDRTQGGTII